MTFDAVAGNKIAATGLKVALPVCMGLGWHLSVS
jgi:hypothetical protein